MTINKKNLLLIIMLSLATLVSAQDAVSKAISSAKSHLVIQEYDKAYLYVGFLLRYFAGKEMPLEALDTSERVIEAYARQLEEKDQLDEIIALEKNLTTAPLSVSSKADPFIRNAKQVLEDRRLAKQREEEERKFIEAEQKRLAEIDKALQLEREKEKEQEEARKKDRAEFEQREAELRKERLSLAEQQRNQLDAIMQANRQAEAEKETLRVKERLESQNLQIALERQRLEAEQSFRTELSRIMEMNKETNESAVQAVSRTGFAIMIILSVVALIVLAAVVIIVLLHLKQQAVQQQQFQNTMSMMTNLRNTEANLSSIALPFMAQQMQALTDSRVQLIEDKGSTNSAILNTPEELKELHEKCVVYSSQIDEVTNRKNASKRVAELAYKISKAQGYSEHDALLFYLVGLIYDIGFLNIDPVVLRSEHISEEQFSVIKTHTTIGTTMVFFIDSKNRQLFKDGVSKHHENLDGTGYPEGLKGEEIPYIARLLRVVETYIALVSSRDYKSIKDRDSAIRELYNHKEHYDEKIVMILDEIV